MPKTLTSRLEDLENEILVLLTLQEVGSSGCQVLKENSVTTKYTDGNNEHSEFEESTCPGTKSVCPTCFPPCLPESAPKSQKSAVETPKTRARTCLCGPRKPRKYVCGDRNAKTKDQGTDSEPEASQGDKAKKEKKSKTEDGGDKHECQDLLDQLQSELKNLECKLHETERQKADALKTSENLKVNYDKLNANTQTEKHELERVKKEKEELIQLLKDEQVQEEATKAAFEKERNFLKDKVEKIELTAVKSTKSIKKHSDHLVVAVRKRDDHIRRLSDTTDELASNILEKKNENKRLEQAHKVALQHLFDAQHANRKLTKVNADLLRSIQEFQDKLQMEKISTQKIIKQMEQFKSDSYKFREEIERLKAQLKTMLEGPKETRHIARLEEKLCESRDREQIWLDEAALMEAKLKKLQDAQESTAIKFNDELERMQIDNTKLQRKYEKAMKLFEELKEGNALRMIDMKHDFDKLTGELTKNLETAQRDKGRLQNDFDQLVVASQRDRKALEDLITRTKQQDALIKTQQDMCGAMDKKIATGIRKNNALQEEILQMDKNMNTLKNSSEEKKALAKDLEEEITNLKAQVEELREEVMHKDDLLGEHVATIENLNNVITNTENKLKDTMEEAQLAFEKARKAVEQLQKATAEKACETDPPLVTESATEALRRSAAEVAEIVSQKVHTISKQYDRKNNLLDKQKQLELDLMLRQKDQAVFAAKFATHKLLETVTDFQKQVDVHKQIQLMLTNMLREKEAHIQAMESMPLCASRVDHVRPKRPGSRGCGSPNCHNR